MNGKSGFGFGFVTGALVVFVSLFFVVLGGQREATGNLVVGYNQVLQKQNQIVSVMLQKHPELGQKPKGEE